MKRMMWVICALGVLFLNVSCDEKSKKNGELTEFESVLKSINGSKIITGGYKSGEYSIGWDEYFLDVYEEGSNTIKIQYEEYDDVSIVRRYRAFVVWENYKYNSEKRNISFYNKSGLILTLHFEEGLSFSVIEWGNGIKEPNSSKPEDLDNPEIKSFQELFEKYFEDAERIYNTH